MRVSWRERTILLVEDSDDDVFFMQDTMKRAGLVNPLQVVRDGQQALDYLGGLGKYGDRRLFPMPCLVLLDLKLPRVSGFEVLASIRAKHDLGKLPVVILSGSKLPVEVALAEENGATFYLSKPPTKESLEALEGIVGKCWLRAGSAED